MHFPQEATGDSLPKQGGQTQVDTGHRKWNHTQKKNKGTPKGQGTTFHNGNYTSRPIDHLEPEG